jgi:hypothetical protein
MRVYWIDTGVLVQNRRKFHRRERSKDFWIWIDKQIADGRIKMPERVYAEIVKGNDWLVGWVKARADNGLCVYADKLTQTQYTMVADHVETHPKKRDGHQKDRSLGGADLWVIAHALANKAQRHVVVSQEDKDKGDGDHRVKIPSVCDAMGVTCYDTFQMLDKLKARF